MRIEGNTYYNRADALAGDAARNGVQGASGQTAPVLPDSTRLDSAGVVLEFSPEALEAASEEQMRVPSGTEFLSTLSRMLNATLLSLAAQSTTGAVPTQTQIFRYTQDPGQRYGIDLRA